MSTMSAVVDIPAKPVDSDGWLLFPFTSPVGGTLYVSFAAAATGRRTVASRPSVTRMVRMGGACRADVSSVAAGRSMSGPAARTFYVRDPEWAGHGGEALPHGRRPAREGQDRAPARRHQRS